MTWFDLLLSSVLLGSTFVPRSWGINWNNTFPRLICYKCEYGGARGSDSNCRDSPTKLKDRPDGLTSGSTYKWTGDNLWQYQGIVLPLQPYCYTRVTYYYKVQKPENIYPFAVSAKTEKDGWSLLTRGVGYPGWGTPQDCFQEPNPSGDGFVLARYFYCSSDYCNTATQKDIWEKCDEKEYGNKYGDKFRAFQEPVDNTTLAGASYRSAVKYNIFIMAALLGLRSTGFLSTTTILTVLTLFLAAPLGQAIMCYSCGDPKVDSPPDSLCNNSPVMKEKAAANCPNRKPPPNNIGMTMQQKGYCAVWISQAYTESATEIEKAMLAGQPLRPKMWLERGCVYPGGEPDECVTADARFSNRRMWTIHYCDTDWCNNETAFNFISRCFPSNNNTVVSSLNDGKSFEGFVFPVLAPPPTVTMDPRITPKQDLQRTPDTSSSDPRSRSSSVRASGLLTLAVIESVLMALRLIFFGVSVIGV